MASQQFNFFADSEQNAVGGRLVVIVFGDVAPDSAQLLLSPASEDDFGQRGRAFLVFSSAIKSRTLISPARPLALPASQRRRNSSTSRARNSRRASHRRSASRSTSLVDAYSPASTAARTDAAMGRGKTIVTRSMSAMTTAPVMNKYAIEHKYSQQQIDRLVAVSALHATIRDHLSRPPVTG